jgi:NAD+ diphosphatase
MNDAPPLSRSDRNFFAPRALDRASQRRKDAAWIAAQQAAPSSFVVPVWRSRNLIDPGAAEPSPGAADRDPPAAILLPAAANRAVLAKSEETVFLGLDGDAAYFAIDLSAQAEPDAEALTGVAGARPGFADLRFASPLLDRHHGNLLAYARGMLTWHRRHRFCGSCGTATEARDAGHLRVCPNPDCAQQQFPRTDPAVIMLVVRGDRCLLGRQAAWPPGMHSTLAGFVEPGETLEAAVAREVFEEAGVRVTDVRYHSSQPWPFPTSLMLGFFATALDDEIRLGDHELEAAAWFDRGAVRAASRGAADFALPRPVSIARRLVEAWLEQG